MNRRQFLGQAAAASRAQQTSPPPRKPNILFILADQWRAQTLVSAGDEDLRAPNLARLAAEGVHFNRAYASNPLCSPSRSSVLTGRFPHVCRMPHNNLLLPLEEKCLAAELKRSGYVTGYIGKWHLDGAERPGFVPPGPRRRGFDYWAAFNRGHSYFDSTYFRDTPEPIRPPGFEPDYQTNLAADFIRQNKANPFYLYLSWGPPQEPRNPPVKYTKLYDPRQFHLRQNVPDRYLEPARRGYAGYYGLCTALDDNIGRLLRVLDESGIAQDTLVIFTADHGDMLGSHGLEYKELPYEESARVPLLMRYPRRLEAGRQEDMLVSNVDLMPTLLALCGGIIPGEVQGRDLAQPIFHGRGEQPDSIYCYGKLGTTDEWRMIVRGFDKLVVDRDLKTTHHFNLADDPFELENLIKDPAQTRYRDELKARLVAWMKRIGDGRDRSGLKIRGA